MTTQSNPVTPAAADLNQIAELKQRVKELEREAKTKAKEERTKATAKAKEVMTTLKQGCPTGQTFVNVGNAAARMEAFGLNWRGLGSIGEIFATVETLETLASHPLVATFGLPAAWLVGDNGAPMGVNGLATIETAVNLASQLSVDTKDWAVKYTAVQVQTEVLPNLVAKLAELEAEARKTPEEKALDALKIKIAKSEATFAAMPNQNSRDARTLRKQITAWEALVRRGPEAFKAKPAALPTTTVISNGPGTIFVQDGVKMVQCRGSRCEQVHPLKEMRVTDKMTKLKYACDVRFIEDLTEEKLAAASFGPCCADDIITGGTQSIPEALDRIQTTLTERAQERQARQNQTAAERQAEGDKPQGGDIVEIDGVEHVVCSNYRCDNSSTLDEAKVPLDFRYVARQHGLRGVEEVTQENLINLSVCPSCAPKRYPLDSQSLTKAIEQIEEIKKAARNEEIRREKARLAALGGADGDISTTRSGKNARKAAKAAKDSEIRKALKGSTNGGGGNQKNNKGGNKKNKKG